MEIASPGSPLSLLASKARGESVGASVSTRIARVTGENTVPDTPVAVAERVSTPWPMATMSSDVSV